MRLIDADELMRKWDNLSVGRIEFDQVIMCAPTIEAEPVRHGHWVPKPVMVRQPYAFNHTCSECGKENNSCSNYCPNCGAKMDEVE